MSFETHETAFVQKENVTETTDTIFLITYVLTCGVLSFNKSIASIYSFMDYAFGVLHLRSHCYPRDIKASSYILFL